MWVYIVAGCSLILAGMGLGGISGALAYDGFESMLKIPGAGFIGPCVAVALIGAAIASELMLKARRWPMLVVMVLVTIVLGLVDRHSGELALTNKVNAAMEVNARATAAYNAAATAKAEADKNIAALNVELAVMTGDDTRAAQQLLGVIVDGKRGTDTVKAMQERARDIRSERAKDIAKADDAAVVLKGGAPATALPFNLHDASMYATLITIASVVLAFLGSLVAFGLKPELKAEDVLDAMEQHTDEWERQIGELSTFLAPSSDPGESRPMVN